VVARRGASAAKNRRPPPDGAPIRATHPHPPRMAKTATPLAQRISERAHGNCSEAYLWLRLNYRRLRKRLTGRYPPYAEVAREMDAAEVRGGRGAAVTEQAVLRIWRRVCKDIEADAQARGVRHKPAPADWKPQPVRPSTAVSSPAPRPAAYAPAPSTPARSPVRSGGDTPAAGLTAKDRIEALRRDLADRNR